jgi:hypothetical protein
MLALRADAGTRERCDAWLGALHSNDVAGIHDAASRQEFGARNERRGEL